MHNFESKYRSYQLARINEHATDVEYLQLKGLKFNSDGSLEWSNENARAYYDAVYKKSFVARKGLKAIYADGRSFVSPKGNIYTYDDLTGRYIGSKYGFGDAFTNPIGARVSEIHMAKNSFSDLITLHTALGHELNHVAIRYFNLPPSEAFAYFWSAESFRGNGDFRLYNLYRQVAIDKGYFDEDFSKYFKFGSFGIQYLIGNF